MDSPSSPLEDIVSDSPVGPLEDKVFETSPEFAEIPHTGRTRSGRKIKTPLKLDL